MKLLLVLVAVGVLFWLLRGRWRSRMPPAAPPRDAEPQAMLACAQCGLHLPRDESFPGRGGAFCSAGHRAAFEAAHPDR